MVIMENGKVTTWEQLEGYGKPENQNAAVEVKWGFNKHLSNVFMQKILQKIFLD